MQVPRTLLAVALLVLATPVAVVGSAGPVSAVDLDRSDAATAEPENSTLTASNVTILGTSLERESLDSYAAIRSARGNETLVPDNTVSVDDTIVIRFEAPGLRSTLAGYDGPNLTTRFYQFVNETNATFHAFHSNPGQRLYRGENVPVTHTGTIDRLILTGPSASTLIPGPANETYYHVVDLETVPVDEGLAGYNSPGIDCYDDWGVALSLSGSANTSMVAGFETNCNSFEGGIVDLNRSGGTMKGVVEGVTAGERFQVRLLAPHVQTSVTLPWRAVSTELPDDRYEYNDDHFSVPLEFTYFEPGTTVTAEVAILQRNGTAERVHEEEFVVPTGTTTRIITTTQPTTTTRATTTTTATPTPVEPTTPTPTTTEPHTDQVPGFTLFGTVLALTCLALLGRRR